MIQIKSSRFKNENNFWKRKTENIFEKEKLKKNEFFSRELIKKKCIELRLKLDQLRMFAEILKHTKKKFRYGTHLNRIRWTKSASSGKKKEEDIYEKFYKFPMGLLD